MSWQPIDCHAHTTLSDGALTPAELVTAVRERGVRPSIADHCSTDVRYAVKTLDALREYLDELERHDVARGGEFCWHDSLWRELPDDLASRFTHRIGSLHAIFPPGESRYIHMFGRLPEGLVPEQYMEMHIGNLERLCDEMPVDILAHPTLVPLALRALPAEDLWCDEHEQRMATALARSGIAFELSARYQPHERIVRTMIAGGVRLSLGSDGHTREQVGDLAIPLELARRLGARDEDLYDPFVHGARTSGTRLGGATV
ncbi:MAG: hypothetical protein M3068_13975 [Gemmatimonadota bacterium]|nr:hypothetical protein [Gemmatimonadota bacterium]